MKIIDILNSSQSSVSFEFFPPKTETEKELLFKNIEELRALNPAFVSITYGAGGSTKDRTTSLVLELKSMGFNPMAHLTCISHSDKELLNILNFYKENGIENILALRGDSPKKDEIKKGCSYGSDLVELIKKNFDDFFCIGVASYPEGHPESPNMDWEMRFFKKKVEKGAHFSITQMFFDNRYFYEFLELCGKNNINIPIIPGIMPITNINQIKKFSSMCGATIPSYIIDKFESFDKKEKDQEEIGVEIATEQCLDLIKNGVKRFHFYTLNKSKATFKVYSHIKNFIN